MIRSHSCELTTQAPTAPESALPGKVRAGLVCINETLKKRKLAGASLAVCRGGCAGGESCADYTDAAGEGSKRRRTRVVEVLTGRKFASFKHLDVAVAEEKALANIRDIRTLLEWNDRHGIRVMRLGSGILPCYVGDSGANYSMDFARAALAEAGEAAKRYRQRLLMHPDQTVQVASPDPVNFARSSLTLEMHADLLDAMGVSPLTGVLIVHGGGLLGDKDAAIARWVDGFARLPERVRRRLVIENDEFCYGVHDCLAIAKLTGIPVVFDMHHHACYLQKKNSSERDRAEAARPMAEVLEAVLATWVTPEGERRTPAVMHVSSSIPGDKCIRSHADYIDSLPDYFVDFVGSRDVEIDLEVEAKAKEKAVFDLRRKYAWIG
jgi:UV DNA damage endonuclease